MKGFEGIKFFDTPEAAVVDAKTEHQVMLERAMGANLEVMVQMAETMHSQALACDAVAKLNKQRHEYIKQRLDQIVCGVFFAVALLVFALATR